MAILKDTNTVTEGPRFLRWAIHSPVRVLYLNLEIKGANIHGRINRMCKALGVKPEAIQGNLIVMNLRGREVTEAHILALARRFRPEVIVIDPLYKMLTGDENQAADMKPILAMFDRITEQTNAVVVYVHHNPKGRAGDRDTRDRGAGSGVLARDFDSAIYLTDHANGPNRLVVSTIARNYPSTAPFTVAWDEGRFVETDEPPVELTTANAKRAGRPQVEPADVLDLIKTKGPLTVTQMDELLRGVGLTRDGAKDLRVRMVSAGTLETYQEERPGGVTWCGTADQIRKKIAEYRDKRQRPMPGVNSNE